MVGGGLLLVGLFTRPVAFLLSGEMAFAYFIGHAGKGFWPMLNGGAEAVTFCFLWLYISAAGAGPWSLDAALKRKYPMSEPAVISAPRVRHVSRAQGSPRARVRGSGRPAYEPPHRLPLRLPVAGPGQGAGRHGRRHPGARHRRQRRDLQRRPRRAAAAARQPRRGPADLHPPERARASAPRTRNFSVPEIQDLRARRQDADRLRRLLDDRRSRWSASASRASSAPASSAAPTST